MKPLDFFSEQLTSTDLLFELTELLHRKDEYYRKLEQKYTEAILKAQHTLDSEDLMSLNNYIAAWNQQLVAWLVYSGHLGYQVNLENFRSPVGVDFLSIDPSIYLKEHIAASLPVYAAASEAQGANSRKLPEKCKPLNDAILDYYSYLETVGPKFAHYAGYVIANEFLPWVEPGYRPDYYQTITYSAMIEKHVGYRPFSESIL